MKIKNLIKNKKQKKLLLYSASILFCILVFALFTKEIVSVVFTIMLLILAILSSQFRRLTGDIDAGIEFITFSTIIFFYAHGFVFAIIACMVTLAISDILRGRMHHGYFISIVQFMILGVVAPFLGFGIALNGLILAIAYHIMCFITFTLSGFNMMKNIMYFGGGLLFNYILFKYFSETILALL